jgi:hypothetical protein
MNKQQWLDTIGDFSKQGWEARTREEIASAFRDSFMKPETHGGCWYIYGDYVYPASDWTEQQVADEHGVIKQDVQEVWGWGARLSASGHMDCTDWAVFDTAQEAADYLLSLAD